MAYEAANQKQGLNISVGIPPSVSFGMPMGSKISSKIKPPKLDYGMLLTAIVIEIGLLMNINRITAKASQLSFFEFLFIEIFLIFAIIWIGWRIFIVYLKTYFDFLERWGREWICLRCGSVWEPKHQHDEKVIHFKNKGVDGKRFL